MVRASTLRRFTARLIVVVSFAALLSAASFQAALAQTAPSLGSAETFSVLGASTVTNTGASIVTGNLGVSPGTAITGFRLSANTIVGVPPGTVTDGPGLVNGTIHVGSAVAAQARADVAIAYADLVSRACTVTYAPIQEIGGLVLGPGVHCFPSSAQVTGTLTLEGGPGSVWIFKIGSTLTTAVSSSVVVTGGAQDTDVFWGVGSSATIGTGTAFRGNILAVASITLNTGASVSGRALALNGAVTMDTNNVSAVCAPTRCEPLPPPFPSLGAAESFSVLGASTVTNTGASIITGDLGVSPGAAITGFNLSANTIVGVPPGTVTDGLGLVNGTIHAGGVVAAQARADASILYGDLIGRACTQSFPPIQEIGGLTLGPGVYCFPSSALLTGTLTLQGGPGSVWVFKIGSTLTTAVNSSVVGTGGARDTDVFWAVGSSATLGTGTAFTGNILAVASITLTTGTSVSGRAVALNGAVTMDTNTISAVCAGAQCLPIPRPRPVSQLLLDHYQCDAAKPETSPRREVLVEDEFGVRTVTLGRPLLVCAPVGVQSDPHGSIGRFTDVVRNTIDHLVCYEIRGPGEHREVLVDNEFGQQPLTVITKPQLLCVPSLQTLP